MGQEWGGSAAGRQATMLGGTRKWAAALSAVGVAAAGLAVFSTAAPAQAAPGDGTIKIRVVQDYNGDGGWDDAFIEPGMGGVSVEITNQAGVMQPYTTDSDGLVTLVGPPGSYRIVAVNPDPAKFDPAPAHEKTGTADTPAAKWLSPNEEFIAVSANQTITMTTGFWDSADYCQSNPLIVTACQPPMFQSNGLTAANAAGDTLVTAPYRAEGADVGKTVLSTKAATGSLYGIGYRKQDKRVFAGAFAKRGSDYGPGGAGAIYVTNASGGPATLWGTVPNVGSRPHTYDTLPGGRLDWNFAPAVGKESLGDLDVSEDGDDLQVINLFTRELLVYDASAATMGAPTHVVDLSANPGCAAASDWRPAALGERKGVLYVGGVCSAESTGAPADMKAIVKTYDADTYAPIDTVMDQTLTTRRELNGGAGCWGRDNTTYRPWSDVGIACGNKSGQIPDPQAWMTDIVIENNGDLIVGFRDRTGDQMLGVNSTYFADTTGTGGSTIGLVNYNVTGDINKACIEPGDTTFTLDMNGACGIAPVAAGQVSGEYFKGDATIHAEAAFGGMALSRGERGIASNAMDPAGIFTQGYASISRGTGGAMQTVGNGATGDPDEVDTGGGGSTGNRLTGADGFGKGQGMADMEVLCDFAPIQIGNRVWDDANGDGIQDAGEKGIAGVTVNIYDDQGGLVATKVTNSRGEYYFDSVTDGIDFNTDYVIRLDNAADHTGAGKLAAVGITGQDAGADDRLDSDGATVNGFPEATITTGNRGENDHTIDFGFKPASVSVGNYVWVDSDGDGIQDVGESGIQGAVLTLVDHLGNPVLDTNGNPVGPVTTDANGHYVFENLPVLNDPAHFYQVRLGNNQAVFADYLPTQTGQGTGATDSSNGSANSGPLVNPGDRDLTLDFGFMPRPVAVGDLVWVDSNGDGDQDPGEPGIPGVTLTLTGPDGGPVTDINGDPVGPVTTDANGFYTFVDLPVLAAGEAYTVHVDNSQAALAPYKPTLAGDGSNPTADSSTGSAASGPLTNAQDRDMTLDFGFVPQEVSVGDFVWIDSDRDGIQDVGEPGVQGVVLTLTGPNGQPVTDVDGNPVGPVTTGPNGGYSFDNLPVLPAGDHYTVAIDRTALSTQQALAGYAPTQAGQGTAATDSSTWTAESGNLTTDGQRDATLDFGFIKPAVSVGNFVWDDLDKDGIQEPGEPGIRGVVMVLTGPDGAPVTDIHGNVVAPRQTGPNGGYSFDDLPALPAGQSYTVSIDRDHQSTKDALAIYVPTLAGQGGDRGADSSTWTATSGDLTDDGDRDPTLDFGFFRPEVSVGDYVWFDDDKDGIQDPLESGIRGVVLELTGPNGQPVTDVFGNPVGSVTTGANGGYSFDHLPALPAGQSYTVTINQAASATALTGLAPSPTGQGNANNDSSTGSATSGNLTTDGARDASLDFGFYQQPGVSVGDFVWQDLDKDGTQEAGEPGIQGVVLVLTGPDGQPVTDLDGNPVGPVTTAADGQYSFDNLPPLPAGQHYTVSIDPVASAAALEDFRPTRPGIGNPASDSSTGSATSGDLTSHGDRDSSLDFGFVTPAVSVGDLVWRDKDRDGIQDAGEPGIPGVVLVLTGPNGQPVTDLDGDVVGPVTTGPDGTYSFDNLPSLAPGQSYTVTVDVTASGNALAGLTPTRPGQGGPGSDSSTGSATSGDLVNDGDRDDSLDFGFVEPVAPAAATLKTKATKKVVAKVDASGAMAPVVLKDSVIITGLTGTGDGVAKLYGPAPKRTSSMCTPGNLAGTVTFTARNGTHATPGVKVTKPGVYTWVVTVKGQAGVALSHKCGLAAETTLVQRQAYGPIDIETGKSAPISAKVGSAGAFSASAMNLNKAPIRVVGVTNGEMVIPNGRKEIGWLNRSAQFGDTIGTSIVAAHVSDNSDNPMAFWKLRDLKKGKVVTVTRGGKTYRYEVTGTAKFSRDRGPGIPKRYFKTTGAHRLVLVTCTDKVTTRGGGFHYTNNLVVTAKLIK